MDNEPSLKNSCKGPQIYLHSLLGFSIPETSKLIGYIKHQKLIVLIYSVSTHNFFHMRVAHKTMLFASQT